MTRDLKTIAATAAAEDAWNTMRFHRIHHLVVGRPIGTVTVSDLLELVGRGLDRGIVTTTRRTLNHRSAHRKSKGVVAAW